MSYQAAQDMVPGHQELKVSRLREGDICTSRVSCSINTHAILTVKNLDLETEKPDLETWPCHLLAVQHNRLSKSPHPYT